MIVVFAMLERVGWAVIDACVSGAAVALVVWTACRAIPRLSPSTRAWLWWLAAARFLVALAGVPLVPLAIPALPPERGTSTRAVETTPVDGTAVASDPVAHASAAVVDPAASSGYPEGADARQPPPALEPTVAAMPGASPDVSARISSLASAAGAAAPSAAGLVFLSIAVLAAVRALGAFRATRRLVARSVSAPEEWDGVVRDVSARLGVARVPDVRVAAAIGSPRLAWSGRTTVLLPEAARDRWTPAMRRMAIGHELAHLARHDLAWGALVAIAERLFVFHPLAGLAAREYHIAREAACDAAVVSQLDHAPHEYGRLLLSLGIRRRTPALVVAGASWSARSLKRRLIMLDTTSRPLARGAAATVVALVVLCGLTQPRLVARAAAVADARLFGFTQADAPTRPAPPAPVARPAEMAIPAPVARAAVTAMPAPVPAPAQPTPPTPVVPGQQRSPLPPPPAPPAPPVPPAPPARPADDVFAGEAGDGLADAWVLLRGDSTMMHGSGRDRRRADALRQGADRLFWFERDGREFVVRDPKVLDAIEAALTPMEDAGRAQAKLGAEQATIGAKQAEVGARQAAVGAQQAALGAKQAAVAAEHAKAVADAMRDGRGADERAREDSVRARQADLERQMKALDADMRAFEEKMRPFEAQQRELETEMRALESAMRKASATAADAMRQAIEGALRTGAAQPVK